MEAQLRLAIETTERHRLSELAGLVWRALSEGAITETEAEGLSLLIEGRKAPAPAPKAIHPKSGARPRTAESMTRRRRWAASGRLPPQIACQFTNGEQAALAVLAYQVEKHGRCDLAIGHIAALGGISETTVRRAFREAKRLGLVCVAERRQSRFRSGTNLVSITDRRWLSWVEMRRSAHLGGGCQSRQGTNTHHENKGKRRLPRPSKGSFETVKLKPSANMTTTRAFR